MTFGTHKKKGTIQACYKNALDFINNAKIILYNNGKPAIAYHLALLAIEEIGKAKLLKIDEVLIHFGKEFTAIDKELDSHNRKLLWALWAPELGGEHTTPQKVEEIRILASNMHQDRLDSLYVSHTNGIPLLNISIAQAENVIRVAEIRLDFAEVQLDNELDLNKIEDYRWFIDANEEDEKKKFIFSNTSLDKLKLFDQLPVGEKLSAWVRWLHLEYKRKEQEMQIQLQNEIRKQLLDGEVLKNKWKIKVKLIAISHSIRPKELKFWNDQCKQIQFLEGNKKKRELFIELTLTQDTHIKEVWQHGYDFVRRILLALNIGSMGLFWYYFLNKGDDYEEEIIDVEHKCQLKKGKIQNPYLYVNWGQKVLNQQDLREIFICLAYLLDSNTPVEQHTSFNKYLKALAFLAKSDLHLNLIANAAALFLGTLKSAMLLYGDLKSNEKFSDVFIQNFHLFITNKSDQEYFISLIHKLENANNNQDVSELTLDRVLQIKILCDFYFRGKFHNRVKEGKSIDTYNK